MTLAVVVPVLNRPHRVAPTIEAFARATAAPHRVLFVPDPNDESEKAAIHAADGTILCEVAGGYATKINSAVQLVDEEMVFLAADDLEPQLGWFEAAVAAMTSDIEVVGVNDLLPRRRARREHATHFVIRLGYAERGTVDGKPGLLHEGYDHSFVDDELIATAKQRGVYVYAPDSHVRHLHWMARSAPDDETYRKGRARFEQDRKLFHERKPLWA